MGVELVVEPRRVLGEDRYRRMLDAAAKAAAAGAKRAGVVLDAATGKEIAAAVLDQVAGRLVQEGAAVVCHEQVRVHREQCRPQIAATSMERPQREWVDGLLMTLRYVGQGYATGPSWREYEYTEPW